MKKLFVFGLCGVLFLFASVVYAADDSPSDAELLKWAASLMQRAVVIDTHADTITEMLDRGYDMTMRNDHGHIDIPRMIEAGINAEFFACWLDPSAHKGIEVQRVIDMIDALKRVAAKDDRLVIAGNAEEILNAKRDGKVAGVLCIEGGTAIVDDLSVLRTYYDLGIRYMTLTWMNNNNWADASGPDQSRWGNIPHHGGLTDFGREVVREMQRIGMIVDISHVHDDTFWDVMEIATKPVIASHSSAWAINPHFRNLKDEQLRAVAKNGGVVGINFYSAFISKEFGDAAKKASDAVDAEMKSWEKQLKDQPRKLEEKRDELMHAAMAKVPRPPLSVLVDHIEHVAQVAGHDHVGLGSDFDGISSTPAGIENCTDLVWIVVELRKRGWSEADIRKFLGENTLRVIRENVGK